MLEIGIICFKRLNYTTESQKIHSKFVPSRKSWPQKEMNGTRNAFSALRVRRTTEREGAGTPFFLRSAGDQAKARGFISRSDNVKFVS